VMQERLGHANIGITLDTYSHVTLVCTRKRPIKSRRCSARRLAIR
jgi:hypothetical protein